MSTKEPSPFGALLLRYRAAARLTQEQLATRAGVSPDAISALERGKRRAPHVATVELLAEALALTDAERATMLDAARQPATYAPAPHPEAQATAMRSVARSMLRSAEGLLEAQPTPLIGRDAELNLILQRLTIDGVRMLTLTGPAGVGKTSLALAVVSHLASEDSGRNPRQGQDRFPDGIVVVDLAPIRVPDQALEAVARAFGLTNTGTSPLPEQLAAFLGERALLVVLDNFEQVLPAGASLAKLLAFCPQLTLLVTSRVPLHLAWEQTLRVAPLPTPNVADAALSPEEILSFPAVELFMSRARARRADFALTDAGAPLVAQLAAQLDGLPLALNLAAARMDVVPLAAMVRRLEDRLRLLRWEAQDVPARQHSLEAAVGWSYDLLTIDEQRLFRHLGVFVGRVSLEAITTVLGVTTRTFGEGTYQAGGGDAVAPYADKTLNILISLAESSLILPQRYDEMEEDDGENADLSFGMLETVREYAQEQLTHHEELELARRVHAHYFVALAERTDPNLRRTNQRSWFLRLEREHDNLRAALRWLLDQDAPDEREAALRLASALAHFWFAHGYWGEGWRWLEEALRRAPQASPAIRAQALIHAGMLLSSQGNVEHARGALGEALTLARELQNPTYIAEALRYLGACAVFAGEWAEGDRLLREALRRWEQIGDPYPTGVALLLLTDVAYMQGRYEDAAALKVRALDHLAEAGDRRLAGSIHFGFAMIAANLGHLRLSIEHARIGLQVSVDLQERWLLNVGVATVLTLLDTRAALIERARLLGAGDALAQATGTTTEAWGWWMAYQGVLHLRRRITQADGQTDASDANVSDASDVSNAGLAGVYRAGQTLSVHEIARLATTLLDDFARALAPLDAADKPAPEPRPTRQGTLSDREFAVLLLVAQGLSSKAIGQRLFISASTVNQHLAAVFNKLGVNTRAQAVAVAAQRGLSLSVVPSTES